MRVTTAMVAAMTAAAAQGQGTTHVVPQAVPTPVGTSACPATPAAPPAALAGWATPRMLTAAARRDELGLATLVVGQAARATLKPDAAVTFALAPTHAGAAGSAGGLFTFTVTAAARYRVALGAGAWIDVVEDGRAVTSVAHAHGPACSGIRKTVDFDLAPGKYVLQVVGSDVPVVTVMVAKLAA